VSDVRQHRPTVIAAHGTPPKRTSEFVGLASTGEDDLSLAVMHSPAGWTEPAQVTLFAETTVVIEGAVVLHLDGAESLTVPRCARGCRSRRPHAGLRGSRAMTGRGRLTAPGPSSRHADAFSPAFPIGHRLDRSMRHWTGLLRTYRPCRFSKQLSSHSAVTCAFARRLIVMSLRSSHRSVIFFSPAE
jgi:hypothetical protein